MAVVVEPTPNPNAVKFSVGQPVGGPATFTAGGDVDNAVASDLLAIDGVASVFMTADFVTLTRSASGDWGQITAAATAVLEGHFT
jgi:2-keto-3-deoxy-6-phosphogluconate aldolase